MKKITGVLVLSLVLVFVYNSCKKEEKTVSPPDPENEFLTTVQLIITNASDPTDKQTVAVKQMPDEDIDYSDATINLKKNTVYDVSVKFLDETTNPAGDITKDIYDRRNYHLICFNVSGAKLTVERTDKDTNTPALEIGLEDKFTTGDASSGSLNVQLRHQPNAKNGSCEPGSSDADVDFPVNIN
ncbi:MAG: hypothetical protein J0H29_04970 [Sphingobacteriales bacterium]|mgnify:CR=1 FL=1|nr:hypothetical protein [Sphingobacteriales bacterium]OJY86222.1 MAG: hypothetical protein BGP14_17275 [Sphingobacteriales bacterium 44-15]